MSPEEEAADAQRTIAVFVSGVAFCAAGFVAHARSQLSHEAPVYLYRTVGVLLFIVCLPPILMRRSNARWLTSASALTFWCLAALAACGFLPRPYAVQVGNVVCGAGFLLFALNVAMWAPRCGSQVMGSVSCVSFALAAGLGLAAAVWGSGYAYFLNDELVLLGRGNLDTLYLSSLANVMHTYGTPSTGLDGVPWTPYHVGSNFLIGQLSEVVGTSVFRFYNQLFGVLFVPLCLYAMLNFAATVASVTARATKWNPRLDPGFWIIPTLAWIGVLPKGSADATSIPGLEVVSESYIVGLTLAFVTLSLATSLWSTRCKDGVVGFGNVLFVTVLIPLLLFACGFTKVSLPCVLLAIGLYALVRIGAWRKPPVLIGLCASVAAIVLVARLTLVPQRSGLEPLHFMRHYVALDWWGYYFPIFYLWLGLLVAHRLRAIESLRDLRGALSNRMFLDVELAIVAAVVGAAPGLIIPIRGGSAFYFSDFQTWFSVCLLLAGRSPAPSAGLRSRLLAARPASILLALVVVCALATASAKVLRGIIELNARARKDVELVRGIAGSPALLGLRKSLNAVAGLSIERKRQALLFIPKSYRPYWDIRPVAQEVATPFIAPALTGVALIDGLNGALQAHELAEAGSYGFSSYSLRSAPKPTDPANLCRRAKSMGFGHVVVVGASPEPSQLDCSTDWGASAPASAPL